MKKIILSLLMLCSITAAMAEDGDSQPTYESLPLKVVSCQGSTPESTWTSEEKLVDGKEETSWISTFTSPIEIILQTESPSVVKSYTLIEDEWNFRSGRAWSKWKIYGTNDSLDDNPWWTCLSEVFTGWSGGSLTRDFGFDNKEEWAFKYYKIVITSIEGSGMVQQMAELKFYGKLIPDAVEDLCETGHTWDEQNVCKVCNIKKFLCDGPVYECKAYDDNGGIFPVKLVFKDVTNHSFTLSITVDENIDESERETVYANLLTFYVDLPDRPKWDYGVASQWGVTKDIVIDNIPPGTTYQIEEIRVTINSSEVFWIYTAHIGNIPAVTLLEGDYKPCMNGHKLNAEGECIACHIHKTHDHNYVDGKCTQCGNKQQVPLAFDIVRAVPAADANETAEKALDGITDNKWCGEMSSGYPYMVLRHDCKARVSRYNLFTGNDIHHENKSGNTRNPKEWKLYAKESVGDPWTEISHVTDGQLPSTNSTQSKDYLINRAYLDKYFQFFKFEIIDTEAGNTSASKIFEVGEINILGEACSHDYDANDICTICGEGKEHQHSYKDGVCTKCEAYEPASGEGTEETPYLIGNAGQLAWYRDQTRNGRHSICAKLTADIDMTPVCSENIGSWMGIYSETAVFDGNGHVLNNLYINDEYQYAGFFHKNSGVIENLGIESGYVTSSNYGLGAVCAYNESFGSKKKGQIINCFNKADVVSTYQNGSQAPAVGGICGSNSNGRIENCFNIGSVTHAADANLYVGAIIGCEVTGNGVIANNYYLDGVAADDNATAMTAEQFKSGEVAWLLNGSMDGDGNWTAGATDGSQPWYQTLGTDAYPVLAGNDSQTVYFYKNCKEEPSYTNDADTEDGAHEMEIYAKADPDGLYPYHCTACQEFFDDHKVLKGLFDGCEDIELHKDGTLWRTYTDVTIVDGKEYNSPVRFFTNQASYSRQMNGEWGTLCLPFDVVVDDTEDFALYEFEEESWSKSTLVLKKTNNLRAGDAMLVYAKPKTTITIKVDGARLESRSYLDELSSNKIDYSGEQLYAKGTFAVQSLGNKNGYMLYGDKFWSISELMREYGVKDIKAAPYRAWLEADSPYGAKFLNFAINEDATAIDAVNTLMEGNAEYYDINGQRTPFLQNGINIVKGKDGKTHKVIVKK